MNSSLSRPGRVLLAALAAGSGVIHLVMVRSHASEWPPEGLASGAVGALQLAIAARGAQFLEDIQTSLLHVWTVPAYTNPLGCSPTPTRLCLAKTAPM